MAADPPLPFELLPIVAAGPVLVALSGGLDSTVLLHRLAIDPAVRSRGLRALHVHHGLQPAADGWGEACQRQAHALGVPFEVRRVSVPRDGGRGLEAAAREARYTALAEAMQPGEVLATAHHLDDQAETFLLRALRASGPEGLGAMRPWRPFAPGWHWRPLLDTPRSTLLAHARVHGLAWIEDPSNASADADRNFLRLQVLPLLRQRWPHAADALARSAALSAQADALLQAEDATLLAGCQGEEPSTLSLPALLSRAPARRARLLRQWIHALGLPPLPANGIARIEQELLPARIDASARFAWAGARILRWRQCLHADRLRVPLPVEWTGTWDGRAPLALPDGGRLELRTIDGHPGATGHAFDPPLQVRARRGGERITLPGRTHSHALKHLLQDHGVPPWQRAHLPLLVAGIDAGAQVLAAGDRIVAAPLRQWLDARGLDLAWQPPTATGPQPGA